MNNVLIIANPSSGQKKASAFVERLQEVFLGTNRTYKLYETKGQDNFRKLVSDAMNEGYDTIAVLGGDGTISKLVNDVAELNQRPKILLIPLGSTNNLARALNSELNEEILLDKILKNEWVEKNIDIGQINNQYFISTVSVGSIPETAWKTDDEMKEKFGSFGYVLEGLQVLNNQEPIDVKVTTDGEEIEINEVFLVVIGLSNSVFGIPTFFEKAEIDDGQLYLYLLKQSDLLSEVGTLVQQALPNTEDNDSEGNDLSYTTSFRQATLESNRRMHFSIDGEKGPSFPAEIKIIEKHLTFLVPPNSE